jgi:hypothetical protein
MISHLSTVIHQFSDIVNKMSLFSYPRAFGLTVCGMTCGLISAMDLGESTDDADNTAGANTLWGFFILILILLLYFMFTLKYNPNTGVIENFFYNAIPAGLSIVVGITVYFGYFFKNSDSSSKYFMSLGLFIANVGIAFALIHGFLDTKLDKDNHPITSNAVKVGFVMFLFSLLISSIINYSIKGVVEDSQDIHPKSKQMFKLIYIISLSIAVVTFAGIGIYAAHEFFKPPTGEKKPPAPKPQVKQLLPTDIRSKPVDADSPAHYFGN